jgi:hypothetical protein
LFSAGFAAPNTKPPPVPLLLLLLSAGFVAPNEKDTVPVDSAGFAELNVKWLVDVVPAGFVCPKLNPFELVVVVFACPKLNPLPFALPLVEGSTAFDPNVNPPDPFVDVFSFGFG